MVPDFEQVLAAFETLDTETFTVAFLGTDIESIFATDFAEYLLLRFTFADLTAGTFSETLAGVLVVPDVVVDCEGVEGAAGCAAATGVAAALELDAELVPKLVVEVTEKL